MSAKTDYNIAEKVLDFRINGFVVFEDAIPHDKIDRILEAWTPIRDLGIKHQGETPSRGWGRYNVRVPFRDPFVDPDIFEQSACFFEGFHHLYFFYGFPCLSYRIKGMIFKLI